MGSEAAGRDGEPQQANRRRLPVAERRRQLLRAALDLFSHRSPEQVSIDDIAVAAGASRPLVYRYFPGGKQQIYEAALRLAERRTDLWKTLGAIYLFELDQRADAERCFRRALAYETDPQTRAELEELLAGK